jgi:hypothetical protein
VAAIEIDTDPVRAPAGTTRDAFPSAIVPPAKPMSCVVLPSVVIVTVPPSSVLVTPPSAVFEAIGPVEIDELQAATTRTARPQARTRARMVLEGRSSPRIAVFIADLERANGKPGG